MGEGSIEEYVGFVGIERWSEGERRRTCCEAAGGSKGESKGEELRIVSSPVLRILPTRSCLPIDMFNPTDHLPQRLPPSSGFLSSCLSLAGILVALWALYIFGLVHSRHQAERLVIPIRPPPPGISSNNASGISERTSLLNAVAQIHGGSLKHAFEWNFWARAYLFGSCSFLSTHLRAQPS
jgi:hypothetical protein